MLAATGGRGGLVINNSPNAVTLTIGNNNGGGQFNGLLADGSGGGAISIVKVGTGTETFAAGLPYQNDSYSGSTTVVGGTFGVNLANLAVPTNLINSGSALTLGSASLLVTGKSGANASQAFAGTTLAGGALASITVSGTSTTAVLGTITRNAGSTIDINDSNTAGVFTTTTGNSATTILAGWATYGSASTWAVNSGTANALGGNNIAGLAIPVANTFSGDVLVTGAQTQTALTINSLMFNATAASLALSGTNVISSGGILVTSAAGATAPIISGAGTLTSGNGSDLIVNDFDTSGSTTISVAIVDDASIGLTKSGGGTLIVSGANTYSGQTTINAGTLSIGSDLASGPLGTAEPLGASPTIRINGGTLLANATFTLNANRGITIAGSSSYVGSTLPPPAISVASTFTMTYGGTITNPAGNNFVFGSGGNNGTLILSGANTYAGYTTVSVGTLQGGATNAFSANSDYTVTSPGILALGGFSQSIGSLAGSGNVTNGGATNATLTVGNDNFTPPLANYTGVLSDGAGGGTLALLKIGTGNLNIGTSGTYTGGTTITGGSIIANTGNIFATTSALVVNSSGTFVLNGTAQTVGSLTGTGTIVDNSNTGNTLTVGNDNSSFTFPGVLQNTTGIGTGALAFTKAGTGTVILSGTSNTYSGTTTVNAGGVLQAGATNAFSPYSTLAPATGATIVLGGFSQAVGSLTNSAGSGTITDNSGNSVTLTIGSDNNSVNYSGTITNTTNGSIGVLSLTKVGRGTQSLLAADSYTGQTTVTAGILSANALSAIPAASVVSIGPNGTLNVAGPQSIASLTGSGLVDLIGQTLTVGNDNGPQTFTGAMYGSGGFAKIGTGTQTIAGPATALGGVPGSTYTGATTVTAGTLALDFTAMSPALNLLSPTSGLTMNGGTLSVKGAAAGSTLQIFNGLTLPASTSSSMTINPNTGTGTTVVLGGVTRSLGGNIAFSTTGTFTTTQINTSNGILGDWATIGNDWAANSGVANVFGGNNIVPYSAYSFDYTDNTASTPTANYGWAPTNNTSTISTAGGTQNDSIMPNSTTNSLRFNTPNNYSIALSGANIITSGGIMVTSAVGANTSLITGGSLTSANNYQDLDIVQLDTNAGGALTIASAITNNGATATGLTLNGGGTLVISGANTYTAATSINAGTLRTGATGTIPSTSAVNVASGATPVPERIQPEHRFALRRGGGHRQQQPERRPDDQRHQQPDVFRSDFRHDSRQHRHIGPGESRHDYADAFRHQHVFRRHHHQRRHH